MNLYEPAVLKKFLANHGLSATKGLGQHFLCSGPVVLEIVASFEGFGGIFEIGPGPGVLTGPLSEGRSLIALELDATMISALKESAPGASVRRGDALEVSFADLLRELPEPRGLVSNLPYYITAPLLKRIAEARDCFSKAILMMQKEVAERVMARAGSSSRGSLSVYLQAHFEISFIADAPAAAFLPPPKVDSRVLAFVPRFEDDLTPEFFGLVRKGFAQPRKTVINNLVAGFSVSRDEAAVWVDRAGLAEKCRPQELTEEEWKRLAAAQ